MKKVEVLFISLLLLLYMKSYSQVQKTHSVFHHEEIASLVSNIELRDEIRVISTGARYIVQSKPFDKMSNPICIKLSSRNNYAIIQPDNGGYRYSHIFDKNNDVALSQLINLCKKTNKRAIIDKPQIVLHKPLIIPSNIELAFEAGSSITAKQLLTVEGTISAGYYQIFDTGNINLSRARNQFVLPEWWGAVGNEALCDNQAINRAINSQAKGILFSKNNEYVVKSVIKVENTENFALKIEGVIKTKKTSKNTVILIKDASNVKIYGGGMIKMNRNDTKGNGIVVSETCTNIVIDDIIISNSPSNGIFIIPTPSSTMKYITIRNVLFKNISRIAIACDNKGDASVWGVRIQNNNLIKSGNQQCISTM